MTVIAYSSITNSIACDSIIIDRAMQGPKYVSASKIRAATRKKGNSTQLIVAGFAGTYGILEESWDHILLQLKAGKNHRKHDIETRDMFVNAIVIEQLKSGKKNATCVYLYQTSDNLIRVQPNFGDHYLYAEGAGSVAAMAAMFAGATPLEAVKITGELVAGVGGPYHEIFLEKI